MPPSSPRRLAELVALWWDEARRNDVLPLDNRVLDAIVHKHDHRRPQATYRYFQGGAPVPEWVAVDTRNRSHAITLTLEVPEGVEPAGTLLALGCALGGWSLHVIGGRLRYVHNLHGQRLYEVVAEVPLSPGRHEVAFHFEKDEALGGRATLLQDGTAVGSGEVERLHPRRLQRGDDRAHLWLRVGPGGGRRLRGALRLQRDHRPGRGERHRPRGARSDGGGGGHPRLAVTAPSRRGAGRA